MSKGYDRSKDKGKGKSEDKGYGKSKDKEKAKCHGCLAVSEELQSLRAQVTELQAQVSCLTDLMRDNLTVG